VTIKFDENPFGKKVKDCQAGAFIILNKTNAHIYQILINDSMMVERPGFIGCIVYTPGDYRQPYVDYIPLTAVVHRVLNSAESLTISPT
jgi:hypothetical protein